MTHAARYPHPDINSLPVDIKAKILEVQEKAGFVPNVFLALARRPAEWRAFFAYHDVLMLKEDSNLTKGEREMIATSTSAANASHEINDDDFAALHAHGFTDEDAWDIAVITAFFGLSNRMASFSNMMPNPEFYLMGRVPKQK